MATATRITGKTATPAATTTATPDTKRRPLSNRLNAWLSAHKQATSWIGAIVAVGALLFV